MSKKADKSVISIAGIVVLMFLGNPALSKPENCENIITNPGVPITEETLYGCDWLEVPFGLRIETADGVRFTALEHVSIGGENPLGDFSVGDGAEFRIVIKDDWDDSDDCSNCHLDK